MEQTPNLLPTKSQVEGAIKALKAETGNDEHTIQDIVIKIKEQWGNEHGLTMPLGWLRDAILHVRKNSPLWFS